MGVPIILLTCIRSHQNMQVYLLLFPFYIYYNGQRKSFSPFDRFFFLHVKIFNLITDLKKSQFPVLSQKRHNLYPFIGLIFSMLK